MNMQTQHHTMPEKSALCGFAGIHPKVATLDFKRLKWKLTHSSEAKMSPEMCDLAEREYRRFLMLKMEHPNISLVPTKLIDEFWHAHILDTAAYARDCMTLFGAFMHHFPYFGIYGADDKHALNDAFAETKLLYENFFGESPPKLEAANCSEDDPKCVTITARNDGQQMSAARCGGHACHVPGSCACREPGACK